MNMKKIAAAAAAAIMALGVCTGVPMSTENKPLLAITAEAAKDESGTLKATVTHSGVSIDMTWENVKNAAYYTIVIMYSTDKIPFSSTDNIKFFAIKKFTPNGDTVSDFSVSIPTIGLPIDINGKPYHYSVQITPMTNDDKVIDSNLYYGIWFDSLDDLEKTDFGGGSADTNKNNGTPQKTVSKSDKYNADLNLPVNVSATGGDSKIDVKWDKVKGAKSYKISISNAGENSYKAVGTVSSESYTIKNLKNGSAYDIMITPDNSNNYCVILNNVLVGGDSSSKSNTQSKTEKVSAPTNIKAKKTSNSVTLTWDKADGADMYRVYKYNEKTGKYEKYKDVKSAKCTISGLKANTKYKFKVVSYSKNSDGKYVKGESSKAVSVTTKK